MVNLFKYNFIYAALILLLSINTTTGIKEKKVVEDIMEKILKSDKLDQIAERIVEKTLDKLIEKEGSYKTKLKDQIKVNGHKPEVKKQDKNIQNVNSKKQPQRMLRKGKIIRNKTVPETSLLELKYKHFVKKNPKVVATTSSSKYITTPDGSVLEIDVNFKDLKQEVDQIPKIIIKKDRKEIEESSVSSESKSLSDSDIKGYRVTKNLDNDNSGRNGDYVRLKLRKGSDNLHNKNIENKITTSFPNLFTSQEAEVNTEDLEQSSTTLSENYEEEDGATVAPVKQKSKLDKVRTEGQKLYSYLKSPSYEEVMEKELKKQEYSDSSDTE